VKRKPDKPVVLISAVNINEGGPLSILQDAVNNFIAGYLQDYRLVLLIHDKALLKEITGHHSIEKIIEYKYPKKSWLLRAWFEYIHCWFISREIKPDLWISLNDITPNVATKHKIVYCQNPAPFYNLANKTYSNEKKLFFFHFFYTVFYRINIKSNKYVIVQQEWLRQEFIKRYKIKDVIVAHPDVAIPQGFAKQEKHAGKFIFFFPALPRAFKNFEVLFKAASILNGRNKNFEVVVTFDGSENSYAAKLVNQYNDNPCLKFIGIQNRDNIWGLYASCSCIVFPSLMETWGLPISEAKLFNKPILVADLAYAHETVGNYNKACFFDPSDPGALAALMEKAMHALLEYDLPAYTIPQQPFVQSWTALYNLILSDKIQKNAVAAFKLATTPDNNVQLYKSATQEKPNSEFQPGT
jgi:glycosyltransferase involved in cell wall biosynthesis